MAVTIPVVPEYMHTLLYKQANFITQFFTQQGLKHWAIGGTLLGARRGGKIIPWDDDCDFGVLETDYDIIFKQLTIACKPAGYTLWKSEHGFKLFQPNPTSDKRPVNIGTDLFLYKQEEDKYVLATALSRKAWHHDWFLVAKMQKLVQWPFSIGYVLGPDQEETDAYLSRLYGKNFATEMYLQFDHVNNNKHKQAGVVVKLTDIK